MASWGNGTGAIRALIDQIIEERAQGNRVLIATTRTKLILKGINPDRYDTNSPDDPAVIRKLLEFRRALVDSRVTSDKGDS